MYVLLTPTLASSSMTRTLALLLVAMAGIAACRAAPAGPADQKLRVVVYGDSVVYAAPQQGSELIQVAVVDAVTGAPVTGVEVSWQVGSGQASLSELRSTSRAGGVAATRLDPAAEGSYSVTARTERMEGAPATISVRVVPRPQLQSVQPSAIAAGAQVTVSGANFLSPAAVNAVYFDDVRGRIISGTATSLTVEVPQCLPSRTAQVRVGLGALLSETITLAVTGTGGTAVSLAPGQVQTLSAAADLACIRLSPDAPGASWILVVHNAAGTAAPPARFQLRTLLPQGTTAAVVTGEAPPAASFAESWEAALRMQERQLGPADLPPGGEGLDLLAATPPPAVGSRRTFSVYGSDKQFRQVTAEVRHVGARVIMYVDVEAMSVLPDEDLLFFGRTFDDPVYPAMVDIFGEPSDIDGNQRVIILFTPRVNALTPRGSSSFITGFFYGCDLVSRSRCSGTNRGEVFYALVPDPTGAWGDARSRAVVRNAIPPVLAHEFQHMIHFARRGFSSDALWLSEGLAHMAEDLMADVLQARGESALASGFRSPNHLRLREFLASPAATAMLDEESPGTLAQRGAAWLFVKYLRGHHGGDDLLHRLTGSPRSSVANVTRETAREWSSLLTPFGVALWAGDAPELVGRGLDPLYRFPGFSPRLALAQQAGGFPLRPLSLPWNDLLATGTLAVAGHAFYQITAPAAGGPQLNLVLAGHRGAALAPGAPINLSLLRVR
jgi:hypothetical protein